jgi:hypothetical protein
VQTLGDTQSAVVAQVVLQAPVPQMYGEHELAPGIMQVPVPLQLAAAVSDEPVQVAGAQVVPAAYFWQPPVPSQKPFCPQLGAPASLHWLSGSVPAGTEVHVPGEPVSAHELQLVVQAVEQQTFCAQKPELHWPAVVQTVPFESLPQLPPAQVLGEAQSVLLPQVVLQALVAALQPYGSQSEDVTGLQVPAPSQLRAGVKVEPAHPAGAQVVPMP